MNAYISRCYTSVDRSSLHVLAATVDSLELCLSDHGVMQKRGTQKKCYPF